MSAIFWSLVERLLPRIAAAAVLLLVALYTSPVIIGVYAWATLLLTGLRALTDQPARQVAIRAIGATAGLRFLRQYRARTSLYGPVVLLCGFAGSSLATEDSWRTFLELLPMAFVPVFYAYSLSATARLQARNLWRNLAIGQLVAACSAILISVPTLILTRSLLGASLHTLVAEAVFAAWVIRAARRADPPTPTAGRDSVAQEYRTMTGYSAVGWTQAQADRLLIGATAGTAVLGTYSFGLALGRSLGDAIAAGTANILRSHIGRGALDDAATRRGMYQIIFLSQILCFLSVVAVLIGLHSVVEPLLGSQWDAALVVVEITSLCALPSTLAWSTAVFHVASGARAIALIGPLVGLVLAVPIAITAATSLENAAWLVLCRDSIVALVGFVAVGRRAPWFSLATCFVAVAALMVLTVA